jgi:hypothetical protein
VRERFGSVADCSYDQRRGEQCLVDVQEQQLAGIGVEPLDGGRPLLSGAAVDEAFVGQLDAATRAGVQALGDGVGPAGRDR